MSGHNKWSKVKNQKAVTDTRKAKIFGQYAKLIAAESKKAGGNRDASGLKAVIEQAKKVNMPKDNIERAVKKGESGEASDMESVRFESYGPGGSALIIEGVTDNNNRTSSEVKAVLTKNGMELAEMGAAAWAFEKQDGEWTPVTTIPINQNDLDKLTNVIEQLEELEDVQSVTTNAVRSV